VARLAFAFYLYLCLLDDPGLVLGLALLWDLALLDHPLWLDDALEDDRLDQLGELRCFGEGDDVGALLIRGGLGRRYLSRKNAWRGFDRRLVLVDPHLPVVVVASFGLVDDPSTFELLDLVDEAPDATVASWFERDPEELERLSGVTILFLEFLDLGDLVIEHGVEDVLDRCRSDVAERVGDEELDAGDWSRRSRVGRHGFESLRT
jgi:hypothetical protein